MEKTEIRFVGHATVYLETGGVSFVTDPMLSQRALVVRRFGAPGAEVKDLAGASCILVSHAHFDHLDLPTLDRFPKSTPVITPHRVGSLVKKLGFSTVIELADWETHQGGDFFVTAVPARHFGERIYVDPFRKYQGYVFGKNGGPAFYFAGDTGYFNGFAQIGEKFDICCALLPIGAYRPAFIMRRVHLNPHQAVQAFRDLKARYMVPIHFGSFKLSLEPVSEPPRMLSSIVENDLTLKDRVFILKNGEKKIIETCG
ncbi:MAG: MBL fold metallo-hydrolase [Deltaproteobacteria bacterium]|nr:MBL fold metallo-hydrolase [Deltaproteobacteria bacterium]